MSDGFAKGFTPNPESALDVLAFVLCPAELFSPGGDADEMAAIAELLGPAKAEAARRWYECYRQRQQN